MAKKKYHQSFRDRMHEHEGMKRMVDNEYYAGEKDRKRQEREDGMMLREDHNAVANLPQNVIMKPYPSHRYIYDELDDTMRVIDEQMNQNVDMAQRFKSRTKY